MTVRRAPLWAAALLLALAAPGAAFDHGVDISSLPRVEAGGARFRDAQGAADALTLLQRAGVDAVRLRLWHTPADTLTDLRAMLVLARRAHALGMRIVLDLHYSDTWADPGHQAPPRAWRGLAFEALADSVEHWTRHTVGAFVAQGTVPARVQTGNEIDHGLLWDDGRLDERDPRTWDRLALLLRRAGAGVRAAAPKQRIGVMLHLTTSATPAGTLAFIEQLAVRGVTFEAIGLSYYPLWHGGFRRLEATLALLGKRQRRPLYVIETGYPWTLQAFDRTHNVVGTSQALLRGMAADPGGQARFVTAVRTALARTPSGRGAGVYWWEPAWIAAPEAGSPWENCALFDSTGLALPALRALGAR